MDRLNVYLSQYSESHQNRTNQIIHKICVPVIMFSVLGLLKALPVPESWPVWLDSSTVGIIGALIFYATLKNMRVFFSMAFFILVQVIILELLRPHFFVLCFFLFVIAWIFQFVGHKIEGKKPSFFKDIFFLLIGPIWVMKYFSNAKDI